MKTFTVLFVSIAIICGGFSVSGQIGISDTGAAPVDPSAVLDLKSSTKGFLPPRMTTTQRDGISSPATGLLIYNTDENAIQLFNGTEWKSFSTSGCEIPDQPGSITGAGSVCSNSTGETYSVSPVTGAITYNWNVPSGATIVSGQGSVSVTVDFGTNSGFISVNAENTCGTSADSELPVTVSSGPAPPGSISGSSSVCSGASGEAYSISVVAGATNYNWTVPSGASIVSGQGTTGILVDFGSNAGNVSVRAENACGNSDYTDLPVTISPVPPTPGAITGPVDVCNNAAGEIYSISPVSGATSYNWTVPTGATIVSGQGTTSVTIDFGTTSGNVSVRAQNACGNSSYNDLAVTVGIAIGCEYAGGIVFYIDGANGYVAAPADESATDWGCFNTTITGATNQGLGAGSNNTALIVSQCGDPGIAAKVCNDLVLNGYSDWFLPSHDEMDQMALNLHYNGIGNFQSGASYWTSSQYGGDDKKQAWTLVMTYYAGYFKQPENKSSSFIFRCARAF